MVDPVSMGSVSLTGDLRRRQTGRKMFVAQTLQIKNFMGFDVLTHQMLQIFIPRETMPSTKSPEPGRQKKGRFSTGVRIFLISLIKKIFLNCTGVLSHFLNTFENFFRITVTFPPQGELQCLQHSQFDLQRLKLLRL